VVARQALEMIRVRWYRSLGRRKVTAPTNAHGAVASVQEHGAGGFLARISNRRVCPKMGVNRAERENLIKELSEMLRSGWNAKALGEASIPPLAISA
jgi:hypothetical protein